MTAKKKPAIIEPTIVAPIEEHTIVNSRPLSATASRALTKLIDNDFLNVKADISEQSQDAQSHRQAEVSKQFTTANAACADYVIQANGLINAYEKAISDLAFVARQEGITLHIMGSRSNGYSTYDRTEATVEGPGRCAECR